MIADIRRHLEVVPFVPFAIRMADGREYTAPTIDHVYLPPGGSRVVVADDQGVTVALPAFLISGLVQGTDNGKPKHGST
jgi:hypothetical protein